MLFLFLQDLLKLLIFCISTSIFVIALIGFVSFFILELFEFMYIFPTVCSAVYKISFDRLLFDSVISAIIL